MFHLCRNQCFSNILLVKTNYMLSTQVKHWSKMGQLNLLQDFEGVPDCLGGKLFMKGSNSIANSLFSFYVFEDKMQLQSLFLFSPGYFQAFIPCFGLNFLLSCFCFLSVLFCFYNFFVFVSTWIVFSLSLRIGKMAKYC